MLPSDHPHAGSHEYLRGVSLTRSQEDTMQILHRTDSERARGIEQVAWALTARCATSDDAGQLQRTSQDGADWYIAQDVETLRLLTMLSSARTATAQPSLQNIRCLLKVHDATLLLFDVNHPCLGSGTLPSREQLSEYSDYFRGYFMGSSESATRRWDVEGHAQVGTGTGHRIGGQGLDSDVD